MEYQEGALTVEAAGRWRRYCYMVQDLKPGQVVNSWSVIPGCGPQHGVQCHWKVSSL